MEDFQPTFNPRSYLQLYLDGYHDQLSIAFIELFSHFETTQYTKITPELQYFIDVLIKNFLYLFTQPDYLLGDRHALRFMQLNPVIANLTAISRQKTTDYYLQILQPQPQNFIKILTLWNARCETIVDYGLLLETNAALATRWYSYYIELYLSAQANAIARHNLRRHIAYVEDKRLVEFTNIADVYFGATYINHEGDRPLKQRLNQAIQTNNFGRTANIKNVNPNPKKIAIVTAFWQKNHAVYQTFKVFLKALVPDYELTLVHLGKELAQVDQDLFLEVLHLEIKDGVLDIEPLRENEFAIAYFPDVGISPESILLANLRLAPIQIAGCGYPVSTDGAKIDYLISGAQVEVRSLAQKNYAERLVLLPGNGVIQAKPNYALQSFKKYRAEIIINCPWPGQQINEPLIKFLGYIRKKATKSIIFRFFPGQSLRQNGMIPLQRDLAMILPPDSFEIVLGQPDEKYLAQLEEGDFSLEAYPFGGAQTMVNSLYLRQPIVGYEGKKWANRIGSQLLRQVGLEELIATTAGDYVKLALKLIENTAYRQGVRDRLRKVNLDETLFKTDDAQYFKRAIAYLQQNHTKLQQDTNREPIDISALL